LGDTSDLSCSTSALLTLSSGPFLRAAAVSHSPGNQICGIRFHHSFGTAQAAQSPSNTTNPRAFALNVPDDNQLMECDSGQILQLAQSGRWWNWFCIRAEEIEIYFAFALLLVAECHAACSLTACSRMFRAVADTYFPILTGERPWLRFVDATLMAYLSRRMS
jgi:hypothetical protein